jgi:hypothetical protein
MILAAASSGRSDFVSSAPANSDSLTGAGAATASIAALPPSAAAAKAETRTVMTFVGSADWTVWIALPA